MIEKNRIYYYQGLLKIKKSPILKHIALPKEDPIAWLAIKVKENLYSFIYRIVDENTAIYNSPFKIDIDFIVGDIIEDKIKTGEEYEVYRGLELVGTLKITE